MPVPPVASRTDRRLSRQGGSGEVYRGVLPRCKAEGRREEGVGRVEARNGVRARNKPWILPVAASCCLASGRLPHCTFLSSGNCRCCTPVRKHPGRHPSHAFAHAARSPLQPPSPPLPMHGCARLACIPLMPCLLVKPATVECLVPPVPALPSCRLCRYLHRPAVAGALAAACADRPCRKEKDNSFAQ